MKDSYFTTSNLKKKARSLLTEVQRYRDWHPWSIQKENTALLVIDMQKYFLDESSHACLPAGKAIIQGIKYLQDKFIENNLTVIQTRHLNDNENALEMSSWWSELINENSRLSEIIPELRDELIPVVIKSQYDAFLHTNLEKLLRDKKVSQIIITGVMTHLCCESTARTAFMRGFNVLFAIDGTATNDIDFHRATLLNLAHGFAVPVLIDEVIENLSDSE